MADYYDLLGVDRSATPDEIKRSYRKLARELHPDRNPGDAEAEARFKEIVNAYETLSDSQKRQQYDQFGEGGQQFADGGGLGDIFDAFFGGQNPFGNQGFGGQSQRGPSPGSDLETIIDVSFPDAVLGSEQTVELRTQVPCEPCEATGAVTDSQVVTCNTCEGAGQVRQMRRSILGQMMSTAVCPTCHGLGETIESPCGVCNGEGRVIEDRTYTVDVPAGVDTGATLRLTGRGAAGLRGAGFGDLYVRIRVRPHDRFERDDHDLIAQLPIPMTTATLGGVVDFETLEGIEQVTIPAGTQTGAMFRLRGAGVPSLQSGRRGDIRIVAVVRVPEKLTDDQKDLMRQFAELRGDEVTESDNDQSLLGRFRSAFG